MNPNIVDLEHMQKYFMNIRKPFDFIIFKGMDDTTRYLLETVFNLFEGNHVYRESIHRARLLDNSWELTLYFAVDSKSVIRGNYIIGKHELEAILGSGEEEVSCYCLNAFKRLRQKMITDLVISGVEYIHKISDKIDKPKASISRKSIGDDLTEENDTEDDSDEEYTWSIKSDHITFNNPDKSDYIACHDPARPGNDHSAVTVVKKFRQPNSFFPPIHSSNDIYSESVLKNKLKAAMIPSLVPKVDNLKKENVGKISADKLKVSFQTPIEMQGHSFADEYQKAYEKHMRKWHEEREIQLEKLIWGVNATPSVNANNIDSSILEAKGLYPEIRGLNASMIFFEEAGNFNALRHVEIKSAIRDFYDFTNKPKAKGLLLDVSNLPDKLAEFRKTNTNKKRFLK